jgi:hypothetical protein
MDRQEMLIMMETDIKGNTKTLKGMVREFIILQMEIRGKDIGRIIKDMGMLYFMRKMEGNIERSGTMEIEVNEF